jgi:hypothetical protein
MTVTIKENPHNVKTVTVFHDLATAWYRANTQPESDVLDINQVYQQIEALAMRATLQANAGHLAVQVTRNLEEGTVTALNRSKPVYRIEMPPAHEAFHRRNP